jgi:dTDP-4-dehydrorhamnose 3,5-epimerase-like enzyme
MSELQQVRTIALQTHSDERGQLTVVHGNRDVPFELARLFYIYNVVHGHDRGGHAHRETHQGFIAITGEFRVDVTDTRDTKSFTLHDPKTLLYVPPMLWVRMADFSNDAVCMVLASTAYEAREYVRDWEEYATLMKDG